MALQTPPLPVSAPLSLAPRVTVEEYFALENASETRYEYVDGKVYSMPGTSLPHNRIALNFSLLLNQAFGDTDCSVAGFSYPVSLPGCGRALRKTGNGRIESPRPAKPVCAGRSFDLFHRGDGS